MVVGLNFQPLGVEFVCFAWCVLVLWLPLPVPNMELQSIGLIAIQLLVHISQDACVELDTYTLSTTTQNCRLEIV